MAGWDRAKPLKLGAMRRWPDPFTGDWLWGLDAEMYGAFTKRVRLGGPDDCWLWEGRINQNGYGLFCFRAAKSAGASLHNQVMAHRVAYEMFTGSIPDKFVVDHLCRTRACVNPRHLDAVSQEENASRASVESHWNRDKTHCDRGHEFTPNNTLVQKVVKGRVWRACRACINETARHRYWDKKAKNELQTQDI